MTKVAFRKDKQDGEIVAVFPETNDGTNTYTSYAHYGQHSACCGAWVVESTRPAKPEEYAELLAELRAIGYDDLQIVSRTKWVKYM